MAQSIERTPAVRIGAVRPKTSRALSAKPQDLLSYSQVKLYQYEQFGWDVSLVVGQDKRTLQMSFVHRPRKDALRPHAQARLLAYVGNRYSQGCGTQAALVGGGCAMSSHEVEDLVLYTENIEEFHLRTVKAIRTINGVPSVLAVEYLTIVQDARRKYLQDMKDRRNKFSPADILRAAASLYDTYWYNNENGDFV